jgi:tetratricopeptide (TPR) repeat protein
MNVLPTALDAADAAAALWRDRLRRDPEAIEARLELALAEVEAGRTLRDGGRRAGAVARFGAAVDGLRLLHHRGPSPPVIDALGTALAEQAALLRVGARDAEAFAAAREAVDLWARSLREGPDTPGWRAGLPPALDELDRAARGASRGEAAQSVLADLVRLLDDDPRGRFAGHGASGVLADALDRRGALLRDLGRPAEAVPLHRRAADLRGRPRAARARSLLGLAVALRAAGDPRAAAEPARAVAALYEGGPAPEPSERVTLAGALAQLAGGPDGAEADRAIATLQAAVAAGFRDPDALARDPALAGLRGRPEFRPLLRDAAMPADPFARGPGLSAPSRPKKTAPDPVWTGGRRG